MVSLKRSVLSTRMFSKRKDLPTSYNLASSPDIFKHFEIPVDLQFITTDAVTSTYYIRLHVSLFPDNSSTKQHYCWILSQLSWGLSIG